MESTSGESWGSGFSRGARCPLPHVLPRSLVWTLGLSSPSGDIPELGLGREERGLSSLYSTSCSWQGCARRALLCSEWQSNTQNHREHSLGDCWQWGNLTALHFRSPQWLQVTEHWDLWHQIKARLKPDCWQSRLSRALHKDL